MSGFATDTTIDTIIVHMPGERSRVRVTMTRDGVNPEPSIDAELEGEMGERKILAVNYDHRVLVDGIYDEDEEEDADG